MDKNIQFFVFFILIIKLINISCTNCFWHNCIDCGGHYQGNCLKCENGYYINSVGGCFKSYVGCFWHNCIDCGGDYHGKCIKCENGYHLHGSGCAEDFDNSIPTPVIALIIIIILSIIIIPIIVCCCKRNNNEDNNNRNTPVIQTHINNRPNTERIYLPISYYDQRKENYRMSNNTNNKTKNNYNNNDNIQLNNNINNNINDNIDKKSVENDLPPASVVMNVDNNLTKIYKPIKDYSDNQNLDENILEKEFEFYKNYDINFNKNENSECGLCSKMKCDLIHFKCECPLKVCKECFIKYKKNFKICPKCNKEI